MGLFQNYQDKKILLESLPADLHLETITGCPYDCIMCDFAQTKVNDVSMELLEKLEPIFPTLEVLSIHGSGESLLSKHLDYFIEKSIENKFIIHTNTTGEMLTKIKSLKLAEAHGLSIRFSIHAGRADTYYKIMGEDFNGVLKKIKYLVDISPKESSDFWFSYIVMKENVDEIEDFLHIANQCGIKSVRFMRLVPSMSIIRNKNKRDLDFSYFDQTNKVVLNAFIEKLPTYEKLALKLGIKIEFGTIKQFTDKPSAKFNATGDLINKVTSKVFNQRLLPLIPPKGDCVVPWYGELVISINGDVKLCVESAYIIGNLYEKSLQEIWNCKKMLAVRKAFSQGCTHKICGYCKGLQIDNYPNNAFLDVREKMLKESW